MHRRQYLVVSSSALGATSLSGCGGVLPTANGGTPQYPGGTLVTENTGDASVHVSATVAEDQFSASLDTIVPAGETVVEREFVTASEGEVATLQAQLEDEGEPTAFEFLPGGTDTTSSESPTFPSRTPSRKAQRGQLPRGRVGSDIHFSAFERYFTEHE